MGRSAAMPAPDASARRLHTAAREIPLQEYRLRAAGRTWTILHAGAVLTPADEARYLGEPRDLLPYGVALWPAAIALAHEVASRADAMAGRRASACWRRGRRTAGQSP